MRRIAIVDDSLIVREGVRAILDGAVEVVASCASGGELAPAIADAPPDVVVTDIRMPPTHTDEGIRLAAELRESHPQVGVVVLSQFAEPDYALALFESGTRGRAYVLKDRISDRGAMLAAIEAVAEGGSLVDPKVVELLVDARSRNERSPLRELTERELAVLGLIAQGRSNTGISDELVLSKRTVEKHINAIFMKLGLGDEHDVSRRVAATLVYLAETPGPAGAPSSP